MSSDNMSLLVIMGPLSSQAHRIGPGSLQAIELEVDCLDLDNSRELLLYWLPTPHGC